MRATVMYQAGDVRIENVREPEIVDPTDAVVRVTRACICGSDLWPYQQMEHVDGGRVMDHEAIGVVEDVGRDVRNINQRQRVAARRQVERDLRARSRYKRAGTGQDAQIGNAAISYCGRLNTGLA